MYLMAIVQKKISELGHQPNHLNQYKTIQENAINLLKVENILWNVK